ncbi:NfeD family protein [Trichothermofontia sp.]
MSLNLSLVWLLVGAVLCLAELFLPSAFLEFTLGVSALLVAVVALMLPYFTAQFAIWVVLSGVLLYLSRRWVPDHKAALHLEGDREAETLTEIPAGEAGRVLYEGNSWRACCEDETITIPAHQKVYVVGRRGTTLIVVPQAMVKGV